MPGASCCFLVRVVDLFPGSHPSRPWALEKVCVRFARLDQSFAKRPSEWEFTGDGRLAVFGAPHEHEDLARRDWLAVLRLQRVGPDYFGNGAACVLMAAKVDTCVRLAFEN